MPPKSAASRTLPPERAALAAELAEGLRTPGYAVILAGEPGSGKSTVVDAALERALAADPSLTVLFARGVGQGVPAGYLGLHELLADVDLDALGLPATYSTTLRVALGLVDPVGPRPAASVMTATLAAVRALLAAGRVAIVVDDLDDIDAESVQVIHYLASRRYADGRAPALLATQTTPRPPAASAIEVRCLAPLSRSGIQAVVRDHLSAPVPVAAIDRAFTRSGGNPMWAIELAARGSAVRADSLDEALRDRIGRARTASCRVLQVVAALGAGSSAQVTAVLGEPADAVSAAVDDGLVVERHGRLEPAHPVLGEAALSLLGDRQRKSLHARLAEVVEYPGARADHLDRSLDAGPDAALAAVLADAAAHARSMGALLEALDLAMRAVQRSAPEDEGARARRILLGEIAYSYGDYETTLDAIGAVPFGELGIAQLDRALPLLVSATANARGYAAARAALRAARIPTDDPVRRAVFDTYLAEFNEDPPTSADLARHALDVLRRADAAPFTRHRALGALILRDVDAGRGLDAALLAEAEALETRIDLLTANDSALADRGIYAYQVGDLAESRHALEAARAGAQDRGEEVVAGLFAVHLAVIELYAGQRARADQWLAAWESVNPWPDTPPPIAVTAYGLRALRDGDDVALRRIVDAPLGPGSEEIGQFVRLALTGLSAARSGRWESAVTDLLAARGLAERINIREPGRRLWLDFALARALLAVGDRVQSLRLADELTALSGGGRPLLDGVAARVRGLAAAGSDAAEAIRLLRTSIELLRGAGYPSEQALSLFELAMAYSDQRERPLAVRTLDEAASLADSSGDRHLLRIIEAARQAIDRTTVDSALTARERAVAYAAARGATNREIAAENHLSVRTVESQLSSVYRKLGVRSRSELVALLSVTGR